MKVKRSTVRKALRLERERKRNVLSAAKKKLSSYAPVRAANMVRDEEILIGISKGLYGHPGSVLLRVDYESLVGCVEDRAELAKLVNNVGILVAAQLFGHNLAMGIDKLAETIVAWAGIDLDKLRAEAAVDAASEPTVSAEPHSCDLCKDQPDGSTCPPMSATIAVPSVDDVRINEETPVL